MAVKYKKQRRKPRPVKRPAKKTCRVQDKAKPAHRIKTAALAAAALSALALGVWLASSPALEKKQMLSRQSELLSSIEQGDGAIELDERLTAASVDFYDNAEDGVDVYGADGDGQAAQTVDSVDNGDHPSTVTGIGVLTIERISLKLPVTEGVSTAQLKVAVGHVPQTAPIGESGNAVIAGHRSYTYGQFFNRLGELAVGDVIQYRPKDGPAMEFTVYEMLEIEPGDQSAFGQPDDKQILTLYTCTPVRTASHRLLVRAERTL